MRFSTVALCLGLGLSAVSFTAEAARSDTRADTRESRSSSRPTASRPQFTPIPNASRTGTSARQSRVTQGGRQVGRETARRGSYGYSAGISCVPYARQATGMEISGNGRDWWHNAAGRYARSNRPEPGAILAFPSSGGMRSGHVAVVSRVVNNRLIEVDHANWGGPGIQRGSVMHGVDVMDVSPKNDWSEVRVQVGWSNENFGRAYPVQGFIHNRPDNGSGQDYASNSGGFSRVSWSRPASASRHVMRGGRQVAQISRGPAPRAPHR